MKLISLAAGAGSRIQNDTEYIPKALHTVGGRTLIEWSLASFQQLRSAGLLLPQDLIFVILESDASQFGLDYVLRERFGERIVIHILDQILPGPAASAAAAIQSLIKTGKIDPGEEVLLNDCDHYFDGGFLIRQIDSLKHDLFKGIHVYESSKDPSDLSWSFISKSDSHSWQVYEKPSQEISRSIDTSRGLVGLYRFSSAEFFLELFRICSAPQTGSVPSEYFISTIINAASTMRDVKLQINEVQKFVPLGSQEQVLLAMEYLGEGGFLLEHPTMFIDLDGTLVEHDAGFFGVSGCFGEITNPLSLSNIALINEMYEKGAKIYIVSARPKSEFLLVAALLSDLAVKYDELILGLTGGLRFLINDVKPSLPGFRTAESINVLRNSPSHHLGIDYIMKNLSARIEYLFPGESGETTVKIQEGSTVYIRKISQPNEASRALLQYQARWFDVVSEVLPNSVPRVLRQDFQSNNELSSLDTEFIPNLIPFGEYLDHASHDEATSAMTDLCSKFDSLYETFRQPDMNGLSYLLDILNDKAIAGLQKGYELLGLDSASKTLPIIVEGEQVRSIMLEIRELSESPSPEFFHRLRLEPDVRALIHGDATLSNVMYSQERGPVLLDPIGTRVLPTFNARTEGLGRTHPYFDYVRMRLSTEADYEKWSKGLRMTQSGAGLSEVSKTLHTNGERNFELLKRTWNPEYSPRDPMVQELFYLTTLCRVFPYKAKEKIAEAHYMLYLIERSWRICGGHL